MKKLFYFFFLAPFLLIAQNSHVVVVGPGMTYIPSELISPIVTQKLPQVCGVAFVKVDYFKLGIVIAHEGYLIDQTNLKYVYLFSLLNSCASPTLWFNHYADQYGSFDTFVLFLLEHILSN